MSTGKGLSRVQADTMAKIEKFGFTVICVMDTAPFAYTIGLAGKTPERRELLAFGLPPAAAMAGLNDLAKRIIVEGIPVIGNDIDKIFNVPVRMHPVSAAKVTPYIKLALWYADFTKLGTPIGAWQMLWPDRFGMWPGTPGFTATKSQPLL
jgi:hypothetical protein